MISKIRGGILSCIGLILVILLKTVVMIPGLELTNYVIFILILQVGFLWFSISLWIVLRYVIVKLNDLEEFRKPLDWLIKNLAFVLGASIISTFFANPAVIILVYIGGFILVINYIVVFVKLNRLDKYDLEFVSDLHSYVLSMLLVALISITANVLSKLSGLMDLDFLFNIFSTIPIVFLMRFLLHEKKDVEKKLQGYSMD